MSDVPEGTPADLVEEIRQARIKHAGAKEHDVEASAILRETKSIGARYKAWVLEDTIGHDLNAGLTPRGRT